MSPGTDTFLLSRFRVCIITIRVGVCRVKSNLESRHNLILVWRGSGVIEYRQRNLWQRFLVLVVVDPCHGSCVEENDVDS